MEFFVVGTSRTGSTLVRHMLAAHPEVGILNESHWVPTLWDRFGDSRIPIEELLRVVDETHWDSGRRVADVTLELTGRTWPQMAAAISAVLGARAGIAEFQDALVDAMHGVAPGAIRRGDKTPDYGFYMGLLQELWPGARFIHVVRNGVDTARSMALHSGCQLTLAAGYDNWVPLSHGRRFERLGHRDLPFEAFLSSWCRRMARIRMEAKRLREGSYLEIRYERLLEQPVSVLCQLSGHLGLPAPEAWLQACAALVRPRPPALPVRAETFRDLPLEHLRLLNDVGGVELLRFGPTTPLEVLEASLSGIQNPPGDGALAVLLSILATRTSAGHPSLERRAIEALRAATPAGGSLPDTRPATGGVGAPSLRVHAKNGHCLERADENELAPRAGEILLFACVRDEALRLPYFLEYYRALGVSRFLFVDNGSSDETDEILRTHGDVHRFRTHGSYSESHCGVHWLNALLEHFGPDHWVLVVDADELLVYPRCEDLDLPALTARLGRGGHDALMAFLLDMYADGPIRAAHYTPGAPFLEACPFFDSDSYTLGTDGLRSKIPALGGVRRRLFWRSGHSHRGKPPYLQKVPLVRWRSGLSYLASTHLIDGVQPAPTTGALLHFKLFSDFVERAPSEVARGEHWGGAAQYRAYTKGLAESPELNPMYEGSLIYQGSRQLVDLGLMIDQFGDRP